ncbi:hypothetical protein AF249_11875 [Listeria monocytogenes]|uniref:hypothetical protein n=1 Tax=Listeria monocytogenes TaxID=1639 RepID=UPI00074D54B5|nr:hypothetical protein [Listeria monocytogenes]AUC70988.1 hypothetical protein CV732_12330 [Listeria monocytogenes]AUF88362.1 hypothetical protein CV733_12620 [Listeria monocytogenes]EAE2624362.1 hypothetical protein [Listeria monocytogenes]EAG7535310.1 hypothetical protein [Listeria monocytogenes]EAG8345556.1 hypothetical protein [Listeria monocytogenes]
MKKGIVLLAGFILAFSIFLVGCGNEKRDVTATDTNDKANFKETKKVDFTPKDFKDYYESTSELYISIINSMMDGNKQGVEESNKKLTQQLNEIDKLIANKNIDNPFNDDLNEYLNNLKDLNTSIDSENYDSTPNISSKLGASVKKLADNNYDGQLPTAVNSFIKQQEENAQSESSTKFGIGDKQTLGGITVTLVSVTKTSERNQFDDTNPKNVVKISYKVENNSGNEYFVNSDIDVYDSNSTIGTRYPFDNTTGKILNGKNINAEYYAGVNESGNIEIVFNLFSDASLTFHAKI